MNAVVYDVTTHTTTLPEQIYLRIEVHFFCLHREMKGHWSCVNLVKCNVNKKKVYFNPYIYAEVTNNPKSRKNQCQFFGHVTGVFHWKIFATVFLCFIAGK